MSGSLPGRTEGPGHESTPGPMATRERGCGRVRPRRTTTEAWAMTARDRIIQRYRQFVALGVSGFSVFLGSVAVMVVLAQVLPDRTRSDPDGERKFAWMVAVLIGGLALGLAAALTGLVRLSLSSRCPWCGGNWSLMVNQISSGQVTYCPYCERPVDGKLPAEGRPGKLAAKGDPWEDELA